MNLAQQQSRTAIVSFCSNSYSIKKQPEATEHVQCCAFLHTANKGEGPINWRKGGGIKTKGNFLFPSCFPADWTDQTPQRRQRGGATAMSRLRQEEEAAASRG